MERASAVEQIRLEFMDIRRVLDEKRIRWWCASKARAYNRVHNKGGVSIVYESTGISRSRIYRGLAEMDKESIFEDRQRKKGGGRKKNKGGTT